MRRADKSELHGSPPSGSGPSRKRSWSRAAPVVALLRSRTYLANSRTDHGVPWVWKDSIVFRSQAWPLARSACDHVMVPPVLIGVQPAWPVVRVAGRKGDGDAQCADGEAHPRSKHY